MDETYAVIDTETNYLNQVISIGIVIFTYKTYKIIQSLYYVIKPNYYTDGLYTSRLFSKEIKEKITTYESALIEIQEIFKENNIKAIFAYNARFDYRYFPKLHIYPWIDIMVIAANKNYNDSLPEFAQYCKNGRLKSGYGVEPIYRYLSKRSYFEVHNAFYDAVDELEIIKMLDKNIDVYDIAKIN